jgi:hypothetical protein
MVALDIPLTEDNLQFELLDPVTFSDPVYTNSVALTGWITKLEVDPSRDVIGLEVTLEPFDIEDLGSGIIEEVGADYTDDTITESGSQPDTITETGA